MNSSPGREATSGESTLDIKRSSAITAIEKDLHQILHSKLIPGLDALRAIAITLVLLDHFDVTARLFHRHPPMGSMGVMIFFVLSGFLITWILLKEYQRFGSISLSNFYRRRTFRIFPSFYVCWMLTTLVEFLAHQFEWPPALVSFFYFMDYGQGLVPSWMNPHRHMWISWSLAIEEKFYLFWPLLLLFLLRKRSTLIRNLGLIILGLWIYRAILFLVFHITWDHFYCTFDMRADALLVGCFTAIALDDDRSRLLLCRMLRWQWLSLATSLVLLLIMCNVSFHLNRNILLPIWTLEPVIAAIILVQFIYWGSKSWTICSAAPVRFTAQISYALYLYHPLAAEITYQLHFPHRGYSSAILMLPMAIASYYLVERPFMRLRDRKNISHRAHPPSAPVAP